MLFRSTDVSDCLVREQGVTPTYRSPLECRKPVENLTSGVECQFCPPRFRLADRNEHERRVTTLDPEAYIAAGAVHRNIISDGAR